MYADGHKSGITLANRHNCKLRLHFQQEDHDKQPQTMKKTHTMKISENACHHPD